MNIDYYKNFITIVECGNLSLAAKTLFIAQPSLSNQIKYLEKMYDTKLMDRNSRKIKLTEDGKLLYESAKEMINIYNQSFFKIKNKVNHIKGVLSVAIPPTVYKELINKNFNSFSLRYPNVFLNIYETNALQAQQYIDNNICEVAITNATIENSENYNIQELDKESFKVFLPENNPLLQKNNLNINDLKDYQLAIPRAYVNILNEQAMLNKFKLNVVVTTTTTRGAIEIARLKKIIAIVPLPNNERIYRNINIKPLVLKGKKELSRKLIWLKKKELSLFAQEFIECLLNEN